MKSVIGKTAFQKIGPGFWGIISEDGTEYRPINMPNQLKYEGRKVSVKVIPAGEEMSVFMWGESVRIVAFETLRP